jgi:hypothetical protein
LTELRGVHHATLIFTGNAISLGRPGGVSGEVGKMPLHEERSAQVLMAKCLESQAIRIHFVLSGQIAAFDDFSRMA